MENEPQTLLQRSPLEEVKASLLYLKSLGLNGVECTDEATKLLRGMGRVKPKPAQEKPKSRGMVRPQAPGGAQNVHGVQGRPAMAKAVSESSQAAAGEVADGPRVVPAVSKPPVEPVETLESIREDLGDCTQCGLFRGRNNIVFGTGNPKARLMFIGDAPLVEEDRQGEPFLGAPGELLSKMLQAMGLSREDVYLTNVLKCCPHPQQGKPDMSICLSFLERQIAVVRPEVICTLGAVAAQVLLGMMSGVAGIRGQFQSYKGIEVMPTFHPTFLLQHPERKRDAWNDLQQVMAVLGLKSR